MPRNILGVEWTAKVANGGTHFAATIDNIAITVKREVGDTWGIFAGQHETPIGGKLGSASEAMCAAKWAIVDALAMQELLKPHADKVIVELTREEAWALQVLTHDVPRTSIVRSINEKLRKAINVADAI